MKITVNKPVEIEVDAIRVELPVRYGTENIPGDFPLRVGDTWRGTIDIATGKIREWPEGQSGEMSMKVCDMGIYQLLSGDEEVGCINENYVPDCIPGRYGDYVDFEIDANGVITNWNTDAKEVASSFFGEQDE